MASIIGIKTRHSSTMTLRTAATLLTLLIPFILMAQEAQQPQRHRVEILHSDELKFDQLQGMKKLLGNVHLQHQSMFMTCDSAYYYDQTNQVLAYSRIHIHQGDTIHIYGKNLIYNGDTGKALMTDSVELVDKETRLFTDRIDYDVNTQTAEYKTGGRILNGDNVLTSITGIYYSNLKMIHFRDSVKIVNPDYIMHADTLRYNTLSEVILFEGPSEAIGDSIYLYCEKGWSDTRNDVSRLMKNAVIDNRNQRLFGDTLYYDKKKGYGEGFGNVVIADTANNAFAAGNYAWYYKDPQQFLITNNASFSMISEGDTMTLRADTLKAVPQYDTSGVSYKLLKAYYRCSIYSNGLQGVCDSLSYSFRDSVARLYVDPVLWAEENQMTADSMSLFTKNKAPDRMELYNTAYIVSSIDSLHFNQVKGKNLTGYFKDNKLFKVVITGNGETVYYVLDGEALIGVNRAKCASIEIYLENGKVKEIVQKGSPDGTIEPPEKTPPTELKLEDFRWLPERRPQRGPAIVLPTIKSPESETEGTENNKAESQKANLAK